MIQTFCCGIGRVDVVNLRMAMKEIIKAQEVNELCFYVYVINRSYVACVKSVERRRFLCNRKVLVPSVCQKRRASTLFYEEE